MSSCAVRCAKDFRKVNAGVSVPELCLVSIDSLYMIYKYSTIHDKYHHGIYFVKQHKRRYYMYHLHVPLFRLHVHVFHDITLYLQDFKDQVVRHIFKWDLDLLPAAVLNFIDKCMEIIWLMCIQEPPMVITWANDGESVNTNYYTFYSRKGDIVKQPVWPAVFLQHGGPLLTRGVVVPV